MQYKKVMEILKTCELLVRENLVQEGDCVTVRLEDGGMLMTDPYKAAKGETALEDILTVPAGKAESAAGKMHEAIYKNRSDINAVITNHAPYCAAAAETEKYIPAVLDDVAQIIGRKARVAATADLAVILKNLKGAGACLVKRGGVVATGRTLDEAHTASLVLEKGAKAYMEATVLGGAKKIGLLDGALMRFVYKKKYSKQDQTAKMEDLKG